MRISIVAVSMLAAGCVVAEGAMTAPAPLPADYEPSTQQWAGRVLLLDELDPMTDARTVTLSIKGGDDAKVTWPVMMRCTAQSEGVVLDGGGVQFRSDWVEYRFGDGDARRDLFQPAGDNQGSISRHPDIVADFRVGLATTDRLVFQVPRQGYTSVDLTDGHEAARLYSAACDQVRPIRR